MLAVTVQTLGQRHDFSFSGFIQARIQNLMLELNHAKNLRTKKEKFMKGLLNAHLITRGHA